MKARAARTNGHAGRHQVPPPPPPPVQGGTPPQPPAPKIPPFNLSSEGVSTLDGYFVCAPLEVVAYARNVDSESWGLLLKWKDPDGREHSWCMPRALLAGDGNEILATLLHKGLTMDHGKRKLIPAYLQSQNPALRVIAATNLGWHGQTFVFPDGSISKDDSIPKMDVLYQSETHGEHRYHTRGTLEGWRESIGRRCTGNSRLVFPVSAAFAGPLLRPTDTEGGGFHLVGASSIGKSTSEDVAGSACGGGPDCQRFARTWRATSNAIELIASMHNDGLLLLDEIREAADPKELDSVAYMLANGGGKGRATKSITERRSLSWRLIFFSTGEIRLSEHAASAGTKVKAGAEVRVANLPAGAGAGMGVFEDLHGAASARIFAEELRSAATHQYGTPLRAFIKQLIQDLDGHVDWVKKYMADFIKSALPPGSSSEVGRALNRFALVAAAGALATKFGITGWDPDESRRAALQCFQAWLADRGGLGQFDVEAGIRQVRAFLEAHGSSRFQSVVTSNGIEEHVTNRLGYWREEEDKERVFLVFPEAFRDQLCHGFDYRMLAKELHSRGLLLDADGNNLMRKERIPGFKGSIRVYAICGRILSTGEDDDQEAPIA